MDKDNEMELDRDEKLDTYKDLVRSSQFIYNNGPGSLVNFPDHILMTAAPKYWKSRITPINDARLAKRLGHNVTHFGLPIKEGNEQTDYKKKMAYIQFPEWYYCPICRRFQKMEKWIKDKQDKKIPNYSDKDEKMARRPSCPHCPHHPTLVPARLVRICKRGHIDDFPWVEWAHLRSNPPRPVCSSPSLKFVRHTGGQGLGSFKVTCSCNASASLSGATFAHSMESLSNDKHDFHCRGRHPWKGMEKEPCNEFPKVVLRGSSSVYFPVNVSSLVIPPHSSRLVRRIEDSSAYKDLLKNIKSFKDVFSEELTQEQWNKILGNGAENISLELRCAKDDVLPILEKIFLDDHNEESDVDEETAYRLEEYDALTGKHAAMQQAGDEFVREPHAAVEYTGLDFLKQVVLIHKIREVRALIGFSRVEPVSGRQDKERFVDIKEPEDDWYPGYEVRGEGIFLELDDRAIEAWEKANPALEERVKQMNKNYAESYYSANRPRIITAKFLLLHSLAHALLRQLSFECGYGIASLRERIYCDVGVGQKMSGLFIYTANGDSEGTLGGLVRQGYPDSLPRIVQSALREAMYCANDPVCSTSKGQGHFALNLAACHSCMLLPETSCEEFNSFLDRSVLVETLGNPNISFFRMSTDGQIRAAYSCGYEFDEPVEKESKSKSSSEGYEIQKVDDGYLGNYDSVQEFLDDFKTDYSLSAREEKRIDDIASKIIGGLQCCFGTEFKICDTGDTFQVPLFFHECSVLLFTEGYKDQYDIARQSKLKCYYLDDDVFSVDRFVKDISQ